MLCRPASQEETDVPTVESEINAADSYLQRAHQPNRPWTAAEFLAAAQVQALLALARAVDKLADRDVVDA